MRRSPPSRGELTADERELWRVVTANVVPRQPHRLVVGEDKSTSKPRAVALEHKTAPNTERTREQVRKPLASIDRRERRDLQRGRLDIDARLDLHGLRVAEAHNRVLAFLARAQREGARVALIVTGKGSGAQGVGDGFETGVLRRQTPLWLSDPGLRHIVAAFGEAAQPHGGAGALYVRIRRR